MCWSFFLGRIVSKPKTKEKRQ